MSRTEIAPWTQPGYADIVSASRSDGEIEVTFGNGDVIALPSSRLGVTGEFEVEGDAEGRLSIRIIDESGIEREVVWSQIRALTDPAFAQEMRRQDTEEARRIGRRLKALREDRNLSQRDLAQMVDMSAPQLSKIESGTFDLRLSTVRGLLRALDADFADIAGPDAPEISQRALKKSALSVGLPKDLADRLLERVPRRLAPSFLARALDATVESLVSGQLDVRPFAPQVAFKSVGKKQPESSALLWLAHRVSLLACGVASIPPYRGIPPDTEAIRGQASTSDGEVTLDSLVRWSWDAGICVLPLHGRGVFSAAVWSVDERPIVVLKDSRDLEPYWLFDLAHELGHIARGHFSSFALIDVEPPSPDPHDDIEAEASQFGLRLLIPNYEELLEEVRNKAKGSHLLFKGAVASTAQVHRISSGLLGMIAAYSLTEVGEYKDRWGSATNLARAEGSGRRRVQAVAAEFLGSASFPQFEGHLLDAAVFSE